MSNWYQLDPNETLGQLGVDTNQGLSGAEVASRLAKYGPNELIERGVKNPWLILWEQLSDTMVVVLIVAAIISSFLGDYKDAAVILIIVVLNAALGFRQEYKAERAMAALKRLAAPVVKVRREGRVREIPALELVPGDIILLETGNLVPADARLLESVNLRVEEAALTGESEPVEKEAEAVFETEKALADRRNMVYMGTIVTYGHGLAVIAETGMQTELGQIATMLQTVEQEPTPLQRRLDYVGRALAVVALVIVAGIFGLGLLRGEEIRVMFLTAVSLAVAAVPEGLPAVVTIALALGAQRMLKRRALIRKLPAVETLGSVTVICSDKTGTLTKNQMTVTILDVAGQRIDLVQNPEDGRLELMPIEGKVVGPGIQPTLDLLLTGAALCNDAVLEVDESRPDVYQAVGDPTEGALVVAAAYLELLKGDLDRAFPRVAEAPFDSVRKRMTTIHRCPQSEAQIPPSLVPVWTRKLVQDVPSHLAFAKGAVDSLLDVSSQVWIDGHVKILDETWHKRIMAAHDQLAENGMRVLGVALRPLEAAPAKGPPYQGEEESLEQDLIFVGMVGMIDPPRPEVHAAVETCQAAGIRPVMITGDHPLTARHIASQLGITTDERFLTGQELNHLSRADLEKVVDEVSVYARVSPEHKLNLIEVFQDRGHIVAMTGDGVNDAPALKKADIGVAMGITGTDVTKEAADMVLQDDNFATIVAAVEEGRTIYDNIRKFIKYLLSCNSGEIWVMLLAPFLGMPLPLLPLQILWMNLVTDGLPALALGVEPSERDTMRRPPYPPAESIFSRGMVRDIIWIGLIMGVVSLGVGYGYWQAGRANWQTMVFTVLTLSQMSLALAVRSERDSFFSIGLLSNKAMLGAVSLTLLLQLAVVYVPFLQAIFETTALTGQDLVLGLALSILVFLGVELKKWLVRSR
jgi:Ca2+-transporting ATPase